MCLFIDPSGQEQYGGDSNESQQRAEAVNVVATYYMPIRSDIFSHVYIGLGTLKEHVCVWEESVFYYFTGP